MTTWIPPLTHATCEMSQNAPRMNANEWTIGKTAHEHTLFSYNIPDMYIYFASRGKKRREKKTAEPVKCRLNGELCRQTRRVQCTSESTWKFQEHALCRFSCYIRLYKRLCAHFFRTARPHVCERFAYDYGIQIEIDAVGAAAAPANSAIKQLSRAKIDRIIFVFGNAIAFFLLF